MDGGCVLVIDEDPENDPYGLVGSQLVDASNESIRTATPLSSHTFGHNNSSSPQQPSSPNPSCTRSTTDIDLLHAAATRPSLDSYQSSSPSTAPPTTPTTRTLDSLANISPTSPSTAMSTPPLPTTSSTTMDKHQQQPRTLRSRREFRIFTSGANTDTINEPDHRHAEPASDSDTNAASATANSPEASGTLRRTNKRKPRPKLGVATFSTSHSHSHSSPSVIGGGMVVIEPSPLSPVIASPRSNRTTAGSTGQQQPPVTPSISYIPTQPTSSQSLDGVTSMEPMSPDVTLDLPGMTTSSSSQYFYIPGKKESSALVSPFGTTFIQDAGRDSLEKEKAAPGGGGPKLQYKPRRRVPTPRKRSIIGGGSSTSAATAAAATATASASNGRGGMGGGSDDMHAHAPISYRMHDTVEMGAAPSSSHEHSHEGGEPEGRRSSLSRWSFANSGQGVLKRLSRLRSNSDLRPAPPPLSVSPFTSTDSHMHASKSAVEPKQGYASRFSTSNHDVNGGQGQEYREYTSDGVPKGDTRRRSTGFGGKLSRILPLPFPTRRGSVPHNHNHNHNQQQHQHGYQNGTTREQAQVEEDEDADTVDANAHLWAMAASHASIPSIPVGGVGGARRSVRLSGAGSAHSNEAAGGHRHSTITVRSSDGWFTTLPSSSVSLTAPGPGNGSPVSATFGGELSRQNSPLNISKTSLPYSHPHPHPGGPYHSASDPTTPTLAALAAASGGDGNDGRRQFGQPTQITAADLLKPSSQRGSLTPVHTRPQSLQHHLPSSGVAGTTPSSSQHHHHPSDTTGIMPMPMASASAPTKADLLHGIQHGDSIRLLDVETAAAIRRSIDFEDRVRKGEDVLRRALFGSESQGQGTPSRTSSFSNGTSGSAAAAATAAGGAGAGGAATGRASAPRGRNAKAMAMERSSSMGGASTPGSNSGPGSRRSGSVDHVRVGRNGLLTGGGVFLTSAVVSRSPAMRYANLNGSFHSVGSSSGLSTPLHMQDGSGSSSGILRTSGGGGGGGGLHSASGTLTRGSSTLREGHEETFGYGNEKFGGGGGGGAEFGVHPVPGIGTYKAVQNSPTLAKRVGRRISRIFVGKGGSAAA